jgi:hypothetical protein
MASRKRKVVLIGAKGFQRTTEGVQVDCFLWSQIGKLKNIRDYDTVLLDLLPLSSANKLTNISWDKFFSLLDFHSAVDILQNGGMIIVVGDPRFGVVPNAPPSKEDKGRKKKESEDESDIPFLQWSGVTFAWDSEPGDTIIFEDDYDHRRFADYIGKLSKWNYSLAQCRLDEEALGSRFNLSYIRGEDMDIHLSQDLFCRNRYQHALAFALRLQFRKPGYHGMEAFQIFGPMVFLPEISLSEDETVQLVLSSICGIELDLPEPEWLSEFAAPGQKTIDDAITRINAELQTMFDQLGKARAERADCRECLKLLYEREYALEPVVRDILRGLGAHVEDPEEKGKEDGWIVVNVGDKTYEGVIEVKSTRSDEFGEVGRKQLLDWIDRGRTLREKNYKGIFIGNSAVDKPLRERPWAFNDNWTKAAKLSAICALKTEDLYVIHLLKARRAIEMDSFWKDLFETDGVLDMKKYLEMLAPREDQKDNPTKPSTATEEPALCAASSARHGRR